jgi:UDP-N-acetylmuramoyl-tripeptide--D-alanyl-D-alanine ligase
MMRSLRLSELTASLDATLLGADVAFGAVSTDSRRVGAGDLFVALKGDQFDGHDFLPAVASSGAVAALVSTAAEIDLPQLLVADTQRALGRLGAYNRDLYRGPLVAITGSSGKTSVKNMASAVLSRRGRTLATEGNYNNEIGVPLTLLRLEPGLQFAVVEMGAAALGDIAWLCELGRPTVSVLLNAMPAHLEGFGSVAEVARAKGEIFDGLGAGDVAVINADQPWADDWRKRAAPARVLDFSMSGDAAVRLLEQRSLGIEGSTFRVATPAGEMRAELALPGEHNVANALAATAIGLACGLSLEEIAAGLADVRPVAGRLSVQRNAAGVLVVDDCYNANPGSVRAAIDTLAATPGRRTLVLGEMRELGDDSETLHAEMGSYARECGIEGFWGVGDALRSAVAAFGPAARWYPDCDSAAGELAAAFTASDVVLVKGSRGARMERLLQALMATVGGGEH